MLARGVTSSITGLPFIEWRCSKLVMMLPMSFVLLARPSGVRGGAFPEISVYGRWRKEFQSRGGDYSSSSSCVNASAMSGSSSSLGMVATR